jgi:hypothetical protein
VVSAALGVGLIALGLVDVFLTVLHYDGSSLLHRPLSRGTWWAVRTVTAPLPGSARAYLRCLGAPLMIPVALAVWISLEVVGFALLYSSALQSGQFHIGPPGNEPDFGLALYTSVVTLSTLGFGEVTPTAPLFHALTGLEALIGFTLLTLTISYILNVYSVLQYLSLLGAELEQQPPDPADPTGLLAAHLTANGSRDLGPRLDGLRQRVLQYQEGLRRYPIVYYFHSRDLCRSIPTVFGRLAHLCGALRWGLPASHPAASDPYLQALTAALTAVTAELADRHPALSREPSAAPAPASVVRDALAGLPVSDEYVSRFAAVAASMAALTGLPAQDSDEEAYRRYREWLAFVSSADAFTMSVADDLGQDRAGAGAHPLRAPAPAR